MVRVLSVPPAQGIEALTVLKRTSGVESRPSFKDRKGIKGAKKIERSSGGQSFELKAVHGWDQTKKL